MFCRKLLLWSICLQKRITFFCSSFFYGQMLSTPSILFFMAQNPFWVAPFKMAQTPKIVMPSGVPIIYSQKTAFLKICMKFRAMLCGTKKVLNFSLYSCPLSCEKNWREGNKIVNAIGILSWKRIRSY